MKPAVWAVSRPAAFGNLNDEAASCSTLVKAWKQENSEFEKLPDINSWEILANEVANIFPKNENRRFVWMLDQFEELFFLARFKEYSKSGDLERFFLFLRQLQQNGVWLITTLRNDFYSQYQKLPEFIKIFRDDGHYDLLDIEPAMLPIIIKNPAKIADFNFEFNKENHIYLNDQILFDMDRTNQALPFLSLTLKLLFEKREGDTLTFQVYESIGKIDGVIKTHTANTVANLKTCKGKSVSQSEVLDILERLIGLNANGTKPFRINIPLDSYSQDQRFIVKQLMDARLLTGKKENNQTIVELALDCLLDEWPEVISAIKRRKKEFQRRQRLIDDAEYWNATGQDKSLLIKIRKEVIDAELQLHHYQNYFTPITESYVEKSMLQTRKKYRGAWVIVFILIFFSILREGMLVNETTRFLISSLVFFVPFSFWLARSFTKKSYLLTIKNENLINLMFFIIFIIASMFFFMRRIEEGDMFSNSSDFSVSFLLLTITFSLLISYVLNIYILKNLSYNYFNNKKYTRSGNKNISSFFLKICYITPNILMVINFIFGYGYAINKFGDKNPDDIILHSYKSYISDARYYYSKKNIKEMELSLENAAYVFNLIAIDRYSYTVLHSQLEYFLLKANLEIGKKNYESMEESINECIKLGDELLNESSIPDKYILFNSKLKMLLENSRPSNKFEYSVAVNQYAICVSRATKVYAKENYPKALLLHIKAINLYKRAIEINPNYTVYYNNLAIEYMNMGERYIKHNKKLLAIESYNKSEKILVGLMQSDNNSSRTKEMLIYLYTDKVKYYFENDFLEKADKYSDKIHNLYGTYISSYRPLESNLIAKAFDKFNKLRFDTDAARFRRAPRSYIEK